MPSPTKRQHNSLQILKGQFSVSYKKTGWQKKKEKKKKPIVNKKRSAVGVHILDFTLYYRVIVIKISMILAQKQTC